MLELHGIPVSPGVAIGPALVLNREGYRISYCQIAPDAVDEEIARLRRAVDALSHSLESNRLATAAIAGDSTGDIFAAQLQMLHDPRLHAELQRRIRQGKQSAAYAASQVLHRYASDLRRLDNSLLAQRADDVADIELQLLQHLGAVTRRPLAELTEPVILLTHNLTPSETANLDRRYVRGFCTEIGGPGGHMAIVAKGLELPAVVGIGDFLESVGGATRVIVDGDRGVLILDPDEETVQRYEEGRERRKNLALRLAGLRDLPAITTDGVSVSLSANIEFPHEVAACLERGAAGIGLYRTEFLYLSSDEAMKGRPVVIRTLDLGADKMGSRPLSEPEPNPFLGLRSIRLSLKTPELFRPQLRAILRAAVHGDVRVMFPLITTLGELRQARMLVNIIAEDLAEAKIPHRADLPVGMMVEVPAAVLMLDRFVKEVDFLSIGTNDLVQYTLAVDRSNECVADLYQASDPAVLRLIKRCVEVAAEASIPLGICGEMSTNPARSLLLVGMGVRSLSVPPNALPKLKKAIRSVSILQCEEIAARAMTLDSARDIDLYLLERLSKLAPELIVA
jgi:phosphotransferase system enzyme I (PtsI)